MIDIRFSTEPCFGFSKWIGNHCTVLTEVKTCGARCPFYKPVGCENWIKRETEKEIWLIPPEEYAKIAEKVMNGGDL